MPSIDWAALGLDPLSGRGHIRSRVARVGMTSHRQLMSLTTLTCLGCASEVITTLFDPTGVVLACGRTRRLATAAQRRVLAARDGGCCYPDCTRPPQWCEAHHVLAWLDGGPTDIDNLALVCTYHHHRLDKGARRLVMIDKLPHWIPPLDEDPTQTPVRNHANHLPQILFHHDQEDTEAAR